MTKTLLDRLHESILGSGRSWPAAEIAEMYLRISAPPAMAAGLIRRILRDDLRFRELPDGTWSAVASAAPSLSQARYMPVWVDTRGGVTPEAWVLWLKSTEHPQCRPVSIQAAEPESWDAVAQLYHGLRPATTQAGIFGRFQQWMCRRHAGSEWGSAHLDLTEWTRIALVIEGVSPGDTLSAARLPEIRKRWNLGPTSEEDPAGILRSIEELVDVLLDRHGSWTEADLHREWENRLAGRPVDAGGFAFSLDSIAELPEKCGVYRFYGAGDALLYVGKAANLARRVRSYFRPYPPERSRREDLMRAVRRFEYDLVPTEIEALIRETRAIRTQKPAWNVMVEVTPVETPPPVWWWPLAFAARGDDPESASLFVLTGPESGYLLGIPPEPEGAVSEVWSAWLGSLAALKQSASVLLPEGVERLEAPESRLALRYYLRRKDVLDRVEPCQVSDGPGFLRSIRHLISDSAGCSQPILPRPGL